MPNVEMHGFSNGFTEETANQLLQSVHQALQGAKYADEVVVTVSLTSVADLKGTSQPFFRLVATEGSLWKLEDLARRLGPLNRDIEILFLHKFVPRNSAADPAPVVAS